MSNEVKGKVLMYKETNCEYAVLKNDLYVLKKYDDFCFVNNVDEATKFSNYGLEVKMLAKYVAGTIVEVFTEKSIKALYEDGEE